MTTPTPLNPPVRLDDLIAVIKKVHEDPLEQLRDAVLRLLETKTVPELTDVSRRDTLKLQIEAVLAHELPKRALRKVYLPQFVIQ